MEIVLVDHDVLALPEHDQAGYNAVTGYLAQLSKTSRVTQTWALQRIVDLVSGEDSKYTIYQFPWHKLTPVAVSLIKSRLEYKFTTVNRILAALRGVVTSCWRMGLIDAESKERLLDFRPVRGHSVPAGRHVSSAEIGAMSRSGDDEKTVHVRDMAILSLIAGTGLRRSEVVTIDLSGYGDLDGHGKSVIVLGKGNKQRTVAVPLWAQAAIDAWVEVRGSAEGSLFLPITRSGGVIARRLSSASVALAVKNMAERAGIEKNLTTHDFRRTYVSNLLDAGVDLAVAQRLVGHSDPKTTARYDRRSKGAERKAVEKLEDPT